uniref:fimbrial protein n=1 Tax=Serratia proteamaculans TaxID=28151 RepID=UPI001F4C2BE0|nr:fimbrial protein [Serratia proteamaculans]
MLYILSFFPLVLFSSQVLAFTCIISTVSTTLTPPAITIQRDLPVGSVIGNQLTSGSVSAFTCSNILPPALTYQQFGIKGQGTYVSTINSRRVYSTNIAGIGYAVGITTNGNCSGSTAWVDGTNNVDGNLNNRIACTVNGLFGTQPISGQALITFYKTSQTTGSGTVSSRQVGSFILRNNQNSWQYPEVSINISSFNVNTLACTITNTAINVNMGSVEKRDFSGVGTWPGDGNTKSFNIPLSCNAGTRVNIKIDGNAQNASQGVLNLSSTANSAKGVGIQLLYKDAPLVLGSAFFTGATTSEGAFTVPLKARYYQTARDIITGVANSSATFTFTYQ